MTTVTQTQIEELVAELVDNEIRNVGWLWELKNWYGREAESFEGAEKQMYLDHAKSVHDRIKISEATIKKARS